MAGGFTSPVSTTRIPTSSFSHRMLSMSWVAIKKSEIYRQPLSWHLVIVESIQSNGFFFTLHFSFSTRVHTLWNPPFLWTIISCVYNALPSSICVLPGFLYSRDYWTSKLACWLVQWLLPSRDIVSWYKMVRDINQPLQASCVFVYQAKHACKPLSQTKFLKCARGRSGAAGPRHYGRPDRGISSPRNVVRRYESIKAVPSINKPSSDTY